MRGTISVLVEGLNGGTLGLRLRLSSWDLLRVIIRSYWGQGCSHSEGFRSRILYCGDNFEDRNLYSGKSFWGRELYDGGISGIESSTLGSILGVGNSTVRRTSGTACGVTEIISGCRISASRDTFGDMKVISGSKVSKSGMIGLDSGIRVSSSGKNGSVLGVCMGVRISAMTVFREFFGGRGVYFHELDWKDDVDNGVG
ncbi:unnamed protein product [Allacma fusca]|uniref:Uncharacterized protein n=1 Tax=Allacma fusca TaxID=39272 RepID=A0A8J2KT74_9HEXA|nr:unnamed protein product [Allacma fusca]